jgi:hypothetical protein
MVNPNQPFNADINGDGELNILILGTSQSISVGTEPFLPDNIALELSNIRTEDTNTTATIYVKAEDIYRSKVVSTALGSSGIESSYTYYSHSLMQYCY